ncbi:hypothetical protein [Mesorhizobium sp. M4A.F.Ca.ET.050.02.1.1]|nr:hypothetical protein [Mesorhizobium sp. M4A.F.Ca.ET.050.02.1.1]
MKPRPVPANADDAGEGSDAETIDGRHEEAPAEGPIDGEFQFFKG